MAKAKRVENPDFSPKAVSKVTWMGPVIKVSTMECYPRGSSIQNLNKHEYVDLRTGEIKKKKHIENRAQNESGIRCTMANIRALVNTNVVNPNKCRWVTLTYAENMVDTKRLYRDFDNFRKRLNRYCTKQKYGKPEYISVIEPQGRGAWHIHVFLIWEHTAPFIPNDEHTPGFSGVSMASLWGHGFTKTQRLADIDNIGAYFSAYLGDIPFEELPDGTHVDVSKIVEKEFLGANGTTKKKKFVKGGRLSMYPPGMQIIRHSRGIKYPTSEIMSQKEAKEKVKGATLTFSTGYEIVDDADKIVNTIYNQYYNTRRKKVQEKNN